MAPAARRVSLKSFLLTARKALLAPSAQRPNPLVFVVGNESADLDSLCSSILLAYFRTYDHRSSSTSTTPGAPPTLHIPLSNLPSADLALRPELAAVLKPAGLHNDDLITLDNLPTSSSITPENTQWLLVDHNALTGPLAARGFGAPDKIIGCIDHHDDEGVVPSNVEPRIIEKSGSCMSLVLEYCKPVWEELSSSSNKLERGSEDGNQDGSTSLEEWESQLAHLALAPILIDTTNLTSKDKTTGWDVRVVEFLEGRLSASSSSSSSSSQVNVTAAAAAAGNSEGKGGYDRTAYFNHIISLKEEIAGLSYRDILRKDYKRWTDGGLTVGISTVVRGFDYLLSAIGDQKQFTEALKAWANEQELDIAAVMTVSNPDGKFTRELLVWAFNEEAVKVAKRFVDKNGGEEGLQLQTWGGGKLDSQQGEAEWVRCWTQGRVDKSRKQVAPMLRDLMKEAARL